MARKQEMGGIPPGFELLLTLRGHEDVIREIAWSPDGEMLASGSNDETIRLWDLSRPISVLFSGL